MRIITLNKSELFKTLKKAVKPDLKPGEYVFDWDYKISKRYELKSVTLLVRDVDEKDNVKGITVNRTYNE